MELTQTQNTELTANPSTLEEFLALYEYRVTDQESFDYALGTVRYGKLYIKEKEQEENPKIAAARIPYQLALDAKNSKINPVETLIKRLEGEASAWRREENRKLAEAHKLKELEAKKKAEEIDFFSDAVPVKLPPIAPPVPTVAVPQGNSYRNSKLKARWKVTPDDEYAGKREFIRECLTNPKLLDYFDFVPAMVEALIKTYREDAAKHVPGVELYRDEIHTAR